VRAVAATVLLSAALAAPAQASLTVGQIRPQGGTPFGNCGSAAHFAQASTGAPPGYTVPVNGVLTSWTTNAGALTGQKLRLDVLHPQGGTTYSVVGTSEILDLRPSSIEDSLPARIVVHPGDVLALSPDPEGAPMSTSGVECEFNTNDTGDVVHSGLVAFTNPLTLPGVVNKERLNVAATVEPDADGDGYGDESQDTCPSSAGVHAGTCPTGSTRIGQTAEPNVPCDQATYVPTGVSWGSSYTVPSAGVMTSWQVQAPNGPDPMKFKVFRPSGASGGYSVIAESPLINVTGGGIKSFPFRLTVQPGDVIGLYSDSNAGLCGRFTTSSSDAFGFVNVDDVAVGDVRTYNPGVLFRFDVAATVEPDADGDGFGDITQDSCPADATRQSCPATGNAFAKISKVGQSANRWRLGRKLLKVSRKPRIPVGTTFRFTLDKAASVRLEFSRIRKGRKVGGHCERATRRNRHRRRCPWITLASHPTITGHAGVNRVRFQGRVSRKKTLVPGRYMLTMNAFVVPGLEVGSRALRFTIVK
jgi:hypothetical protein